MCKMKAWSGKEAAARSLMLSQPDYASTQGASFGVIMRCGCIAARLHHVWSPVPLVDAPMAHHHEPRYKIIKCVKQPLNECYPGFMPCMLRGARHDEVFPAASCKMLSRMVRTLEHASHLCGC